MRIRLGCSLSFDFPKPTPIIATLNVHYSRASQLERPDHVVTTPFVPIKGYRDLYGNWCSRMVAPAGRFTLGTDAVLHDDGLPDATEPHAAQHALHDLPEETLVFLLGSRYCETDLLTEEAWARFGHTAPGAARVQAVCDFVHSHITFGYEHSRPTRTAHEAFVERRGVCRDYTHLAIALCRALNIPARYCTGYVSDINLPPPYGPMDFAAWMEVYLGGAWHMYDPRNNAPRWGRVLVAQGRDAADVPLTMTFGANTLANFVVWADEVP
ncbi:transglutaminase-like domain-containing protein [Zavarzinia sp. CC-PAN008]|uniref:transglutaminase-like domain-containing protein n=1 Tax=Zavarzinia sp. CC-PAN008 TaxID=3243332 RepID=UPI003F749E21